MISTIYDNLTESGFKPITFKEFVYDHKIPNDVKINFRLKSGKPLIVNITKKIKKKDLQYENKAILNNKKGGRNVITK